MNGKHIITHKELNSTYQVNATTKYQFLDQSDVKTKSIISTFYINDANYIIHVQCTCNYFVNLKQI